MLQIEEYNYVVARSFFISTSYLLKKSVGTNGKQKEVNLSLDKRVEPNLLKEDWRSRAQASNAVVMKAASLRCSEDTPLLDIEIVPLDVQFELKMTGLIFLAMTRFDAEMIFWISHLN